MLISIIIFALAGLSISIYAYFVEGKIKKDASYKPACDINDHISCSKPLRSKYSNIFYFSNALMSIAYYSSIIMLAYFNQRDLIFLTTLGASIVSLVLAYILYCKIKSLCVVCTSLYLINFTLLALSYAKLCA